MLPGTSTNATVLDSATRDRTRVLLPFSLSGRLRPRNTALGALVDRYTYGRFASHLMTSQDVLPVPVLDEQAAPRRLRLPYGDHGLGPAPLRILVVTCFDRERIELDDRPLPQTPAAQLGGRPLAHGQSVHQLVFPGGRLQRELLSADEARKAILLDEIVYRGRMPWNPATPHDASLAPHVSDHGATLSALGGVSVQAGWAPHVRNGLVLVAVGMISALSVLQRARLAAFAMMKANEQALTDSPTEIRSLISRLSAGVDELRLDLAFGVEAYVDGLLIPEMVPEAFQASPRDALGLRGKPENSARTVERLTSVISARSAAPDAELAERGDRRDRTVSGLVAAATLIALPPTLLLAFFGVNGTNVDEHRSILDVRAHGTAYAPVRLPFVVLVVIGWILLRRVSTGSGSLLPAPDDAFAPVPPPRSPSGTRRP
ncbi:hypothetical protein [Streptomyces sp. SID5643]|uniref:hypothetical protein n=1 Tax=Streptomyces sp. SID5643 TaxID=2690307 RepID=UPI0013719509|nr:hypothetical protein [Streptomyces sp. SID5643]MZF90560.1 hypothetical protein [Streptomyces sp. SID5643]